MVQNPTNDAAHSSYDELKTNADGSSTCTSGPTAPAGEESNWIETVPGRGFYLMFRFYSPTAPLVRRHVGAAGRRANVDTRSPLARRD